MPNQGQTNQLNVSAPSVVAPEAPIRKPSTENIVAQPAGENKQSATILSKPIPDADDLLKTILGKLDRGDGWHGKWPDGKGEYWALCPYHSDQHAANFSVSVNGFKCFACGESGGLRKLAEYLGIELPKPQYEKPIPTTLEEYARYKALSVEFLKGLGLKTVNRNGKSCIQIPYYDEDGNETTYRIRWNIGGDKSKRFTWKAGSRTQPYGLERLHGCTVDGRVRRWLFLIEGESDAQTLWSYGLPALGIPGATNWQSKWKQYVTEFDVYIWQEPDDAGQKFVDSVAKDIPGIYVIRPPSGRKDISDCHLAGDDIPSLVATLTESAILYADILAERLRLEAIEAAGIAAPLLKSDNILGKLSDLCAEMGLVDEDLNAKLLYLAMTSRVLEKPISLVVKGTSSSGKSFTVETILKMFPDSAYYALSSMSEHALAYSKEPLSHRFLVLYEAAGLTSDFGSYLLRTLLSEGHIRYETVEKTSDGLKPKLIERDGPTGIILTTTWANLHPENETRMLSLVAKDDREQTAGVLKQLAGKRNGSVEATPDLKPWIALQRWIELSGGKKVIIPFAPLLAELANPKAVRLRRDFSKVLDLIAAHAILHQYNRETDDANHIIATLADYEAVYSLVSGLINETVKATVSNQTRETVAAVAELTRKGNPTNVTKISDFLKLDKSAGSRRVKVAIDDGYLQNDEDRKGHSAKIKLGEPMPEEEGILPSPEKIKAAVSPGDNRATVQHLDPDQKENEYAEQLLNVAPPSRDDVDFNEYKKEIDKLW